MSTRRWFAVVAVRTLLIAGGLAWMFLALGPDRADQISGGIGAGPAVLGIAVAVAGVLGSRSQVGGSITGTVHTGRDDDGKPAP